MNWRHHNVHVAKDGIYFLKNKVIVLAKPDGVCASQPCWDYHKARLGAPGCSPVLPINPHDKACSTHKIHMTKPMVAQMAGARATT